MGPGVKGEFIVGEGSTDNLTFPQSGGTWASKMQLKISSRLVFVFALIFAVFQSWRRQWQPTPVLLPGKSHGQRSLVGCSHGVARSRTRLSDFTFTFLHWRRKWQPTPVFLPGESQGRGSLVGCRLWGCTESDTTEAT